MCLSVQRAEVLGREDEFRLLRNRQLALLVDLDQTLLHTTNDNIPPNLKVCFVCTSWYHGDVVMCSSWKSAIIYGLS